jgi:uncharacterized membrane protein
MKSVNGSTGTIDQARDPNDRLRVKLDMSAMFLHYAIVFSIFLVIDAAWLMTAGRTFYVTEIGGLLRPEPNLVVAFAFYALYALGLLIFVIEPALAKPGLWPAVITGGLFGLVAYATYDMTNLATLKGFTWRVAAIDMLWGTLLSASVTFLSLQIIKRVAA